MPAPPERGNVEPPRTPPQVMLVGSIPHPVGGVTQHVWRLADMLAEYGCEVLDLHPNPCKYPLPNVRVRTAPNPKWLRPLWLLQNLATTPATTAHFHFSQVTHLWWLGKLFTRAAGKRQTVLTLHHGDLTLGWRKLSSRRQALLRSALSSFSRIVSLSWRQREFYEQEVGLSPSLLHDSTSFLPVSRRLLEAITPLAGPIARRSPDEVVLVTAGSAETLYQHEFALDLLAEVRRNHAARLCLCLYGKPESAAYEQRLLARCRSEGAEVFPDLDFPNFIQVLRQADLYVRPSTADSFGIAVADAIEQGVPVVASDVCDRYPGTYLCRATDYAEFSRMAQRVLFGSRVGLRQSTQPLPVLTPEFYGLNPQRRRSEAA